MARFHCVFDTSALLPRYAQYEAGYPVVQYLFTRSVAVAVHFPEVGIPEVTLALYRLVKEGRISGQLRRDLHEAFLADIRDRNIIVHHLSDRDIIATDEIVHRAWWGRPERPRASAIDAMILAVTLRLAEAMDGVVLVTSDAGQKHIARGLRLRAWDPLELTTAEIDAAIRRRRGRRR